MADDLCGLYWIGHVGSLHPILLHVGEHKRTSQPRVSLSETLSGRVLAQLSPRRTAPRSWSIGGPDELVKDVAALGEVLAGLRPPYVWVEPWAQVTNLLTPRSSLWQDTVAAQFSVSMAGRYPLDGGGYAAATVVQSNVAQSMISGAAPVVQGLPVTVAAWVAGTSARVNGQFLDSNRVAISQFAGNTVTGVDVLRRSHKTFTPAEVPSNAVAVRLFTTNASVAARAQVTWTSGPVDWSIGGGASTVVVTDESLDTTWAVPDPGFAHGRRASVAFTVTEIGAP
ncbi:hypothetical protein [Janibacter terrae]|uniref:hypothetical protein n=1 Tax=Janibacter terrae TaxID=103817 RepID=UPI00082E8E31|nr:hypothetical protein [Janibacter terrae]